MIELLFVLVPALLMCSACGLFAVQQRSVKSWQGTFFVLASAVLAGAVVFAPATLLAAFASDAPGTAEEVTARMITVFVAIEAFAMCSGAAAGFLLQQGIYYLWSWGLD